MTAFHPNLFYALWPDDTTRTALLNLQAHIRGRHIRYANLHLTLAFLGAQADPPMPVLRTVLKECRADPFTLRIDRLGFFAKNRIAWAGAHTVPSALTALHDRLTRSLESHGIGFDKKNFTPHITLARNAGTPEDFFFDPIDWIPRQLVLAQSPLPNQKPHYRVLASQILWL